MIELIDAIILTTTFLGLSFYSMKKLDEILK